jgi:large subunit ribosomal protein L21
MIAVVDIAGQQFKVQKDMTLFVHRLEGETGDSVAFEKVLLLTDGTAVTLGAPFVAGAQVQAKILGHLKGDKVIIFKKKRRKGYKKTQGHRQQFTQLQIETIVTA